MIIFSNLNLASYILKIVNNFSVIQSQLENYFILGFEIVFVGVIIYFSGKKIIDAAGKIVSIAAGSTVIATGINTGFGTRLSNPDKNNNSGSSNSTNNNNNNNSKPSNNKTGK